MAERERGREGEVGRGLEPPAPELWRTRNRWFWRCHDANAGAAALELDPEAELLLAELEAVFSAGAWMAVVILAWTLVESSQRAAARADERPPAEIDWLREQRNAIVHADRTSAASLALDDDRALEATAQGAVRVLFRTLFAAAWR